MPGRKILISRDDYVLIGAVESKFEREKLQERVKRGFAMIGVGGEVEVRKRKITGASEAGLCDDWWGRWSRGSKEKNCKSE
jgi:hypothetical protein